MALTHLVRRQGLAAVNDHGLDTSHAASPALRSVDEFRLEVPAAFGASQCDRDGWDHGSPVMQYRILGADNTRFS